MPVIVISIVAFVSIVGSAGVYLLTRATLGGRAQLSSLAMKLEYPSGWRDRTADRSFTSKLGCGGAAEDMLPDPRCEVVLTKGDDSIFMVISIRPPSVVTDADLADALD